MTLPGTTSPAHASRRIRYRIRLAGRSRSAADGATPVPDPPMARTSRAVAESDRKSTRLNSSHLGISYAVFCLNDTATTEIYTLSLHDALPIWGDHDQPRMVQLQFRIPLWRGHREQ